MNRIKGAHAVAPFEAVSMVPPKPPSSQPLSSPPSAPDRLLDWVRVRQLALRQLNRLTRQEAKVLKGDDRKAVHDLRVASRRLQQLLDLLFPGRPKEIRRLRRKVRSARRVLSEVRNCDVHLDRVETALSRKRTSQRSAWVMVQEYLVERRAERFRKAARKIGKANLDAVSRRLKEHLDGRARSARQRLPLPASVDALSQDGGSNEVPLREFARLALGRAWRDFEAQLVDSRHDPKPEVLHQARISTKRLRYLVEVFEALDFAGSDEALAVLRQLQKHLGDWHDLETFEETLIEMVARPKFLAEHLETAMAAEKLIVRSRRAMKSYVTKYFDLMLDSGESQRLRLWVKNLLGETLVALQDAS